MKLYELQKQFMQVVQPNRGQEVRGGAEADAFICEAMKVPQRQDPELCLHIYRDSSIGGRFKALRNVFPCCERIVGEQFFWQMAMEFLQQPSNYLSADAQGEQFSAFINHYKAATSVPYLTDLAKLEWLWYQVFHGPEGELGAKTLTSIYPLTQLWEMCQPEYKGDFVLQEINEPLKIMIIQREQRIHMLYL